MNSIFDNLNPQQLAAVSAPPGPLLIVAGAGSGKTRVVTRRVAHLVQDYGVKPRQFFVATFTNKAAQEMQRRVGELVGYPPRDFPIATFHSLCARILRREASRANLPSSFTICDEADQLRAVKQVMAAMGLNDKSITPSDARHEINQAKMKMVSPEELATVAETDHEELYAQIYHDYERYLQRNGAVDFEDLILKVVEIWRRNPDVLAQERARYQHVLVDEYQDTNHVQFELVRLLAGENGNLMVVGDEDQSIYSWRGADITNLLEFQRHFPTATVVRLEQNYRSHQNILTAADHVIKRNTERLGKTLFSTLPKGAPIYVLAAFDSNDEGRKILETIERMASRGGVELRDIAIFFRTSSLSRGVEDALRQHGVAYRMVGGLKFYDRAEVKDLVAYLQVASNPHNDLAMLRIINTPKRSIGDKSVQTLTDYARCRNLSLFDAMRVALDEKVVPAAAGKAMKKLTADIDRWTAAAQRERPAELLRLILTDTDFVASLGDPQNFEVKSRTENIQELDNAMIAFESQNPGSSLQEFLENVALVNDEVQGAETQAVSLMTLHAAKGLEFRVVFLMGLDAGIFPNPRAVEQENRLEEERRLFYVGITRAREILVLTRANSRIMYGSNVTLQPSQFLYELPKSVLSPLEHMDMRYLTDPTFDGESSTAHYEMESPPPPRAQRAVPLPEHIQPRTHGGGAQLPKGMELGSRVRHTMLGDGVISAVSGSGRDTKVLMQTDDGQEYELIVRLARLQVICE